MACSAAHALVPSGQTLPELLFFERLDCKQLCNQHQALRSLPASARVRCLTVQNSYQEEQREYERLSGMQ